jgi:hypothetical protein
MRGFIFLKLEYVFSRGNEILTCSGELMELFWTRMVFKNSSLFEALFFIYKFTFIKSKKQKKLKKDTELS